MFLAWPWMIFILSALAIAGGCLLPARFLPPLPNDKLMHFAAYAGLSILAGHIATDAVSLSWWLASLFVSGWAIEVLQKWVPGRNFCWRDFAANTAGIVLAGYVMLLTGGYQA